MPDFTATEALRRGELIGVDGVRIDVWSAPGRYKKRPASEIAGLFVRVGVV